VADTLIQTLQTYLRQGKPEPSYHLILQLFQREGASAAQVARLVGESLDGMLEAFQIQPVVAFTNEMEVHLPAELVEPLRRTTGRRIAILLDWSRKIALVGRERVAREIRGHVRGRRLPEAEKQVAALLGLASGRAPDRVLVEYLGSVLGSVEHGRREAEQLIGRLRAGTGGVRLAADMADLLERAFHDRTRGDAARSEFREAEFSRELTSLAVELKGWLPGPRVASAPAEEQIQRFYEALHAVAASVFMDEDPGRWSDVTLVLVEYCPRDLSIAGRRAGVEERAYMTLTPTARRTVFEAMGRLGRNAAFTDAYLAYARAVEEERLKRFVIEVMGATHGRSFLPHIRTVYEQEALASVRSTALLAVSNYADGESAEFLLHVLRNTIGRGKRRGVLPEGPERREANQALFALGRVVRSPRMDAAGRNEIFKRAVAEIPDRESRLQHELAHQCFRTTAEGWDPSLRDWAVATLTRSFWQADMTPDFAPGDDRQTSIVGARGPMVETLVALGKDAVPAIVRTCEEGGLGYGGAYVALAETLGRIGDPRALDTLERILATALLVDPSGRTKYQSEKYYDSTEGARKDLTPDQVVAALLFAVERIGGEAADLVLVRAYNQVIGAANPVGPETNGTLERLRGRLMRDGSWNTIVKQAAERRLEPSVEEIEAGGEKRDVPSALKLLRSVLFWPGKRRPQKIGAIQLLAAARNLEAIPFIVRHLEDGDPLVRGAAETALGEYAWAASNETIMRALLYSLIDGMRNRNDEVRGAVTKILRRLGPTREPLRSKLVMISQSEPDPLVRAEAARLLDEGETEGVQIVSVGGGVAEEASPETAAQNILDEKIRLKREYLLARQEWIRGGKRGDAPKPPAGL